MKVDTQAYDVFKKLKGTHSVVTILITEDSVYKYNFMYKTHRDLVAKLFKDKGVEVTRWTHDYPSLTGAHPKLGLVYLANDSVIVPGIEVHGLMGYNVRLLSAT